MQGAEAEGWQTRRRAPSTWRSGCQLSPPCSRVGGRSRGPGLRQAGCGSAQKAQEVISVLKKLRNTCFPERPCCPARRMLTSVRHPITQLPGHATSFPGVQGGPHGVQEGLQRPVVSNEREELRSTGLQAFQHLLKSVTGFVWVLLIFSSWLSSVLFLFHNQNFLLSALTYIQFISINFFSIF